MSATRNDSLDLYIRRSAWVNAHGDGDIHKHSLNRTESGVLGLLYHKGAKPIQQIGSKVLKSCGIITYVVDKLEKKAYVKRKTSTEDHRLFLTEFTKHVLKKLDKFAQE
jgi:MarR family 2-MHQ and catechol resistance regulon transcriptional repressor